MNVRISHALKLSVSFAWKLQVFQTNAMLGNIIIVSNYTSCLVAVCPREPTCIVLLLNPSLKQFTLSQIVWLKSPHATYPYYWELHLS